MIPPKHSSVITCYPFLCNVRRCTLWSISSLEQYSRKEAAKYFIFFIDKKTAFNALNKCQILFNNAFCIRSKNSKSHDSLQLHSVIFISTNEKTAVSNPSQFQVELFQKLYVTFRDTSTLSITNISFTIFSQLWRNPFNYKSRLHKTSSNAQYQLVTHLLLTSVSATNLKCNLFIFWDNLTNPSRRTSFPSHLEFYSQGFL